MLELSENDVAVHFCTFQTFLQRAKVNIRFPSLFFVDWKTINGKNAVSMVGRKKAVNSQIELNETLIFTTEMLYHRGQKLYLKKESLLHLNLISNSRPDQIKLVGRVLVDLSEVANSHLYSNVATTKLMYCSVDAEISFSMKISRSIQSNIELNQLDRSSFNDLYSFTTCLKNGTKTKEKKENVSEKKSDQQRKKSKNRFFEKQEETVDIQKGPQNQIKVENILIKDQNEQVYQIKSLPNSLPFTEKREQPIEIENFAAVPKQPVPKQVPKNTIGTQVDAAIRKQKDSLERQLNQHKNRVKKLQYDIRQVLRLFEQSQQKSELNKSKLIKSEQMINNLKDTQAKIKEYYEKQMKNLKDKNARDVNLLRSSYEADIKILKATIEQQKLNSDEERQNNRKMIQNYQILFKQNESLKLKLKEQPEKISKELTSINQQKMNFHEEKRLILASIDQKEAELFSLQGQNLRLKKELEAYAIKGKQAQQLKQQVFTKNAEIQTLRQQINNNLGRISYETKSKTTQFYEAQIQADLKLQQITLEYEQKLKKIEQQLTKAKQQIENLKQENQKKVSQSLNKVILNDANTLQKDLNIEVKQSQAIKIEGQQKMRVNIDIGRMEPLQQAHNQSPIEHDRHDFNFGEHLTHEQINKISQIKDVNHYVNNQELTYLRIENNKLKDQIEELKFIKESLQQHGIQQPQDTNKDIQVLQEQMKNIKKQNQNLKEQITILKNTPVIQASPVYSLQSQNRPNEQLTTKVVELQDQLHKTIKTINQLQSHLLELQKKNEQLSKKNRNYNESAGKQEKENMQIKQLQAKLINLQQQLNIKDQILIEGERMIEQNYAIKYELADLKEKYSEIKSALDQRDELINYLEQTKQQLSKELQQVADKSRQSAFQIELKDVKQDIPSAHPFQAQQENNKQLNGEVQALRKQLVSLNNHNIQLRNQLQQFSNQKLSMERTNLQNFQKLMQNQTVKKQLQTQINELSQQIYGQNTQVQLQKQNIQARQQVEQLTFLTQKNGAHHDTTIKLDVPQLKVHEVDSSNDASPIEYEHSVIQLEYSHLSNSVRPVAENINAQMETLKKEIEKLSNLLNQQTQQKDLYFNNLEISNLKVVDLQFQVVKMKEQIEKLNSLPIQSFAVSTPNQNFQYAETSSKNMKQPSIMYQPRAKGEADISQSSPQKIAFQKDDLSKGIDTRVSTNVQTKLINQAENDLLKQELEMLKQQLESQAKLHYQLQEIHNMCQKKYQLLNNQHQNSLSQLYLYKSQNEELTKGKEFAETQLHNLRDQLINLHNYYQNLQQQFKKKYALQSNGYQQKFTDMKSSQQKLINKISLLQGNIINMEKSLQQQIQINQENDKITQKLEQLNELQLMASHFQQQIQKLKEQNQLLLNQKDQLLKNLQQHNHCLQQRAEWQQKLQIIQNLMNNQSKFVQQKHQLQNKIMILNEEKDHLQAQKTIIYQNLKKESEINIKNQIDQLKKRQNELYAQLQVLRNEKLSEMQKVAQLEQKINKDMEAKTQKIVEFQSALQVRQHEIQQTKFIKEQLTQEVQETKLNLSQKHLYNSNQKAEIQKLTKQNKTLSQEIVKLREQIQQKSNFLNLKDVQIQHLQEQIAQLSSSYTAKNQDLQKNTAQINCKRQEISLKIASIQQLQNKLKQTQSQIINLKSQLLKKDEQYKLIHQKLQNSETDLQKSRKQTQQLDSIRNKLQKQFQILNARYAEVQNAIKNTTSARDRNSESLKIQISKKQQEISELSRKIKSNESEVINQMKQLENWKNSSQKNQLKIKQLAQKEKIMKETIEIIQKQAQKVVQSLKSRYKSEQVYYRKFIQKERQNGKLSLELNTLKQEVAEKERILLYQQEKGNQLKNDLQSFKKSTVSTQASPKIVNIQYEKYQKLLQKNDQLINKNKEYLQIISQKKTASIEGEKLKRQFKQAQQIIEQIQQNRVQTIQNLNKKISQLQKQLESVINQKKQLIQTVNFQNKQIETSKQQKIQSNHKAVQNLIQQKDKQINQLKENIKKVKPSPVANNPVEEPDSSSISILNKQILNLNKQILQKDNELQMLKAEISKKDKCSQSPKRKNIDSLGTNIQNIQVISNDLRYLCQQIKKLCQKRSNFEQSDKLFQSFVEKYDQMEYQFNNFSTQTSVIQEKAKFISKQLQKVKSYIIKGQNRPFKQKTQLLALIKPCEVAAYELVNISQTLGEKESQNFI